jgi:hypothetical protein
MELEAPPPAPVLGAAEGTAAPVDEVVAALATRLATGEAGLLADAAALIIAVWTVRLLFAR